MDIYAGSVFLYEAVGWNIYISAACILGITAVYTVLGRLITVHSGRSGEGSDKDVMIKACSRSYFMDDRHHA